MAITPEMARAIREALAAEDDELLAEELTSAVYACVDEEEPASPAPKGKPKLGMVGAESDDD